MPRMQFSIALIPEQCARAKVVWLCGQAGSLNVSLISKCGIEQGRVARRQINIGGMKPRVWNGWGNASIFVHLARRKSMIGR